MSEAVSRKRRDEIWDFRTANTKQHVHSFHTYPAMMIPQVAGQILDKFGNDARLLFDPYCGTGTSLVEANIRGINAIGTDINPLARLIAKVKTTPVSIKLLDRYIKKLNELFISVNFERRHVEYELPTFNNIDYWFKKDVQIRLAIIKNFIEGIKNRDVQDFFKVAFSETIREVSLTRNSEFKLYRMKEEQIEKFNPDVFRVMEEKTIRNRNGMEEYIAIKKNESTSLVYDFNTVEGVPLDTIELESIDIVVTSPPYGDSRTTVAYGQFSRLANQWLGFEQANQVDKKSMGGIRTKKYENFGFEPLDSLLSSIANVDKKRVLDVVSFYIDYRKSIDNVSMLIRKGGVVAYVVGNRRVKGNEIPTDEITRYFFEKNGFEHIETIVREIPNKRMPSKNSPSNVVGATDSTMKYEYIVILRKK